jgi:hypothetical protein
MKTSLRLGFLLLLALSPVLAAPAETKDSAPTEVTVPVVIAPSDAFRSYIQNLKISGVFHGSPRAIYVDNRVIRVGYEIDRVLGIRLFSVDLEARVAAFEDKSGAQLSKKY